MKTTYIFIQLSLLLLTSTIPLAITAAPTTIPHTISTPRTPEEALSIRTAENEALVARVAALGALLHHNKRGSANGCSAGTGGSAAGSAGADAGAGAAAGASRGGSGSLSITTPLGSLSSADGGAGTAGAGAGGLLGGLGLTADQAQAQSAA